MISNTFKQIVHFPKLVQRRVWFLWSCYFLFQVGFLLVWILTSTLFLKIFGVKNVPFLFITEGVFIMLGSWVTRKYFLKTKTSKFLKKIIFALLLIIGSALFFQDNLVFILAVGLMAKSLIYPQLQLGLFKKIESFFSPHMARKAIPFIETAETIGLVLGSVFVLGVLQVSNSLVSLFYWWSVPLVLLLFLIKKETRLVEKIKELVSHTVEDSDTKSNFMADFFSQKKFIRGLVCMILFQSALFATLEISFLHEVESHHETVAVQPEIQLDFLQANLFDITKEVKGIEAKITQMAGKTVAHELGVFALLTGLIALFFKLFLTPQLLKRWGIFGTILSFFSFFALGVLSFFMGRSSAEMLKGIQHGTYSVFASPYHISFYACNEQIREKLRHFLHGFVWPLGSILAAGVLWFLFSASATLLGLVLLACLTGIYLNRNFSDFTFKNYQSAHSLEEKLHILEMLESFKSSSVAKQLATDLLDKNKPFILRRKIIETLIELGDSAVVHEYLHILNDDCESDEIKICVLDALYVDAGLQSYCAEKAFTENKLFKTWQTLFALTGHRHLKKLVLMNIFKHISNEKTVDFLRQVLVSGDEHLLAISLRSCMQFDDPEIVSEILPLLEHESSRIRSHVILAIWRFSNDQEHLKNLIQQMLNESLEEDIISAVYAIGELQLKEFLPQLIRKLPRDNGILRVQILIALLKLGQKHYVPSLSRIITGKDPYLANMAFYMRKRLPQSVQEFLEEKVYKQVSHKVDSVLKVSKSLDSIPTEKVPYFQRLFLFSEQYESLLALE